MQALQDIFNQINSYFGLTLADIRNGIRVTIKDYTAFHGNCGEVVYINHENGNVTVELESGVIWTGPVHFLSKESV